MSRWAYDRTRTHSTPAFGRGPETRFGPRPERPADLDRENAEPKELDNRLVEAVTKGGTIVRGRTAAVQGPLDQLIVEGVLQPLPIRFPGEHWRLANGWKTLNFHKKEADSGLHRP